jgi:hypothetical protein
MKGSMRAATAIGVGYLLGRRRKLRTATLMAAAYAVGGTTVGSMVLKRGMKMLNNSEVFGKIAPQLTEMTDVVRGDLLTAGKAAATAAVSNRVDSLTDSLHDHAERLRNPAAAASDVAEGAGEAAGTAGRAASGGARRAASTAGGAAQRVTGRRGTKSAEPEDEDYREDEDFPEGEADEAEDYEDGEPDDYADEPDEDEPEEPVAARPRRGGGSRRSPVSRTRG